MAKRKARRLLVTGVVTPDAMSKTVVGNYVTKARTEVRTWSRSYVSGVTAYTGDTTKQGQAYAKLGAWYRVYLTEVYPGLVETFARGKKRYVEELATVLRAPVATATPPA